MFDIDGFLADCRAAGDDAEPRRAVQEVLTRAIDRSGDVADALRPAEGGITVLDHGPTLTVLHVVWAPGMRIFPHDHRMWALIGIYAGQEDNTFYRRSGPGRTLTEAGGRELSTGDVLALGRETIHAVSNPEARLTGAIHIYGGDFLNQPRSQWGPGPLEERPYDMGSVAAAFEQANERWRNSP